MPSSSSSGSRTSSDSASRSKSAAARADSAARKSRTYPDRKSEPVLPCQKAYSKWLRFSAEEKAALAKTDPETYVLMRAFDLRIEYAVAHNHHACYVIAVVKKNNLVYVWVSGVNGRPPSSSSLLPSETRVRIPTEKGETNEHHAEVILLDLANKEGFEVVNIACTKEPCEKYCLVMYKDNQTLHLVPIDNRTKEGWNAALAAALGFASGP